MSKHYSKVIKVFERYIGKYIDANAYLLQTDDQYVVNCHLKPRLVAGAVEDASSRCRKLRYLLNCQEDCLSQMIEHGVVFAAEYVNLKTSTREGGGCVENKVKIS